MMKNTYVTIVFLLFTLTQVVAQKSGVNTKTPTEALDVNGNARVRSLANYDLSQINAPIVTQSNVGIIGKGQSVLVPIKTATGFNATDNSTAMFVIRRYEVGDWPDGSHTGYDTGMSTSKWEAVMSNVAFFTYYVDAPQNTALAKRYFGWQLESPTSGINSGKWVITGDVNGIREGYSNSPPLTTAQRPTTTRRTYVDILFINKKVVTNENRSVHDTDHTY